MPFQPLPTVAGTYRVRQFGIVSGNNYWKYVSANGVRWIMLNALDKEVNSDIMFEVHYPCNLAHLTAS